MNRTEPTTPASHHAGSTVHTNRWGEPENVPGCEGCAYRTAQAEAVAARERARNCAPVPVSELGYTRKVCAEHRSDWPCGPFVEAREAAIEADVAKIAKQAVEEPVPNVLTVTIRFDGAAIADDQEWEVARILRVAALRVEAGDYDTPLHDSNGNRVGRLEIGPAEVRP